MWRWLGLVALLGSGTGATAAPVEPWQATGPFKLASAPDRCVASASFSRGDQTLVFALEGNPTNESYEMRLYAPGRIRSAWEQGSFSLGKAKLKHDWVVVRPSSQRGTLIYTMITTRTELISAGVTPTLAIQGKLSPGKVTIIDLTSALPLVEACSSKLLETWGYSTEFQQTVASPAKPLKDWSSYASPSDYPAAAISLRLQGETHTVVDVGVDGRASNCRVIRSSGHKDLDATTCMIATKRARYDPARNKRGDQIAAPLYLIGRWELPKL